MPNDTPTSTPENPSVPTPERVEAPVNTEPSPETEAASRERQAKRAEHEGAEAAERDEILPTVEKKIDEQGNPVEGEAAEEKPKDPMGMLEGLMQKFEGLKKQFLPMLAQMANVLPFLRKMVLDSGIFDGKEFSLLQASKKHSFEFHESVLKKEQDGKQSFILPPDMDKLSADDVLGMFDKQNVGKTLEQEELVQIVQAAVGKKEVAAAEAAKKVVAAMPTAVEPAKPAEAAPVSPAVPAEAKDLTAWPAVITFEQFKSGEGVKVGANTVRVTGDNSLEVNGRRWELRGLRGAASGATMKINTISWENNQLKINITGSRGLVSSTADVQQDAQFAKSLINHLMTDNNNKDLLKADGSDSGVSLVYVPNAA